jgi:hypothetical protein
VRKPRITSRNFLITSARNDTPLHRGALAAALQYCEHNNAQLIVIATRYRNPDAYHLGADSDMTWPREVEPYLLDADMQIHKSLMVMGDAKINATAVNPLTGFESVAGGKSAIYGHAQVQMTLAATPRNELPRILHTTGTLSLPEYSRSTAGKKAAFHHSFGGLVVELRGRRFHMREVLMEKRSGAFYDLDKRYAPDGVTGGHRVLGAVLGDEHVKFICPRVRVATFGRNGIVQTLRPQYLVRHDVHDHYSGSHHHEKDTLLKVEKAYRADDCVRAELELVAKYLEETTPKFARSLIVQSNHHDHVRQWLNRFDANRDPGNALFAWKLLGKIAEAIESGADADPFRVFLRSAIAPSVSSRIEYLNPNDPYVIGGVSVEQHGDRGPNGSRGSLAAFGKLVRKMFIGHGHSPGINKGTWQVGVSAPGMGYAQGLSSWLTTHGVIYANGKRAMLHIIDGHWRA